MTEEDEGRHCPVGTRQPRLRRETQVVQEDVDETSLGVEDHDPEDTDRHTRDHGWEVEGGAEESPSRDVTVQEHGDHECHDEIERHADQCEDSGVSECLAKELIMAKEISIVVETNVDGLSQEVVRREAVVEGRADRIDLEPAEPDDPGCGEHQCGQPIAPTDPAPPTR
jgi:hypothetical protein